MGLLDWLGTDIFGSAQAASGMAGDAALALAPPEKPVVPSMLERQPEIPYQGIGGLPPRTPMPLEHPGIGGLPSQTSLSPGVSPASDPLSKPRADLGEWGGGSAQPPGPPLSIVPPAPDPVSGVSSQPGARPDGGILQNIRSSLKSDSGGLLTSALGLDKETAKNIRDSLGAGFKAAGDSSGKSPFQAFASGAGAAIEGGKASDEKNFDRKLKYLNAALAAQKQGDHAEYQKNYLKYLNDSLRNETEKAASGRSAWNKPDTERYNNAMKSVSDDPSIKASMKNVEMMLRTASPDEATKILKAHDELIAGKKFEHLQGHGFSGEQLAKLSGIPQGHKINPFVVKDKSDLLARVKPGQAFVNPADGRVYIMRGKDGQGGQQQGGQPPGQSGGQPPAPPVAPKPPNIPRLPLTGKEDEED